MYFFFFFFFFLKERGGGKGWRWVTAVNPRRASTVTTKTPRKKRKRMTNDDDNNLCGWKTTLGPANGGQRENLSQALSIKNKFSQKLEFFQNREKSPSFLYIKNNNNYTNYEKLERSEIDMWVGTRWHLLSKGILIYLFLT